MSAPRMPALMLAALLLLAVVTPAPVLAALPIEHWSTANGVRVYFVRADAIPMLDVSIDFDAGARFDPPDKRGLASMTRGMMARGAKDLDEAAIDDGFARIGAQFGGGASDDRAGFALRTLTRPAELDRAIALLAQVLATPQFPQAVLDREKARTIDAIREAETRPGTIAQKAFGKLTYGTHPYGQQADAESVAAIGRDDLVAFHRRMYGASHAVVAMIGAVSTEQARDISERLTRGLGAGEQRPEVAAVKMLEASQEQRIAHPASQAHLLVGAPLIARGDPDFFPLFVGNYVLGGGGFVSRLYSEIREKRGLAYSVYSYFSPMLQPGPFTIGLQTRKEQADEALQLVRQVLARFVDEGPTTEEVKGAQDNLVGGFALRIDSNRKILDNLAMIGFYRMPLDYLDTWTQRVSAVTRQDIADAFRRRVHPQAMATVMVGAAAEKPAAASQDAKPAAAAPDAAPAPSSNAPASKDRPPAAGDRAPAAAAPQR